MTTTPLCSIHDVIMNSITELKTDIKEQATTLKEIFILLKEVALSKLDRENIHKELADIKEELKELRYESTNYAATRERSFTEVFQKLLLLDQDLRASQMKIKAIEDELRPLTELSLQLKGAWKILTLLWLITTAFSSFITWYLSFILSK